jgi:general secretion pathway protein G
MDKIGFFPRGAPITRGPVAGFSLLEILVVLALIGIIVSLAARYIADAYVRGQVRSTEIAIANLAGKIQSYIVDNGTTPLRLDDLLTEPAEARSWMGPYAQESELEDAWGRALVYRPRDDQAEFDLRSYGADGRPGGQGLRAADIVRP